MDPIAREHARRKLEEIWPNHTDDDRDVLITLANKLDDLREDRSLNEPDPK